MAREQSYPELKLWCAPDVLHALVEELKEDQRNSTNDILGCGADIIYDLLDAMHGLSDNETRQHSMAQFLRLTEFAHQRMASSSASSSYCWRRLYTDACILWSLAEIAFTDILGESTILESIGRLDRAIVVAGAPGEGRLELAMDCIHNIQSSYLPVRSFETIPQFGSMSSPPAPNFNASSNSIPCILPPSFASFERSQSHQPFILRGHTRSWPAMNEHPWASDAYLRSVAGPGRIVPIEVGSDYRRDDWTQRMMNWDDFLSAITLSHRTETFYLAQHNLLKQFPALREDIIVPDYVYAALLPPASFPKYKPPGNDEQLVINAWLGPAGTESPAHTDPFFNLYAQVVGSKTVWLAPPSATPYMYPYSPASDSHSHNPAANTTEPSMSNTSQVDVFADSDHRAHPEFWEKAAPDSLTATLQPGDLLFFPPGWWHAMRSEEKSFSVSMWF